jgi:hypothetical protein
VLGIEPAFELGIAERGSDGVGIRVAMTGDIDRGQTADYGRSGNTGKAAPAARPGAAIMRPGMSGGERQ